MNKALVALAFLMPATAAAQLLTAPERAQVDAIVREELAKAGAPSASVAVLRGGTLAYATARGRAELVPERTATPATRYAIGSVSKQFTAAALLLLAEDGRLSLDDTVAKHLPWVPEGTKVTLRQLLSHTSGYRDYYPQDFTPLTMQRPITPREIATRWGVLDFAPGTRWQYSNTGYIIAGLAAERAAGVPLFAYMKARILDPLGMASASIDAAPLAAPDAAGYARYALGPLRPAPQERSGWMYAAGELAMTPSDLAKWNLARAERRILKPSSWAEMERTVLLLDGRPSGYGLGVFLRTRADHRSVEHGGEVSGFLAENRAFPDDRAGVTVLVNSLSNGAGPAIANRITSEVLFPAAATGLARAKLLYAEIAAGRIDPERFTVDGRAYFTPEVLEDYRASLAPLGAPTAFTTESYARRGGLTAEVYKVVTPRAALSVVVRGAPDGRVEQFTVAQDQ